MKLITPLLSIASFAIPPVLSYRHDLSLPGYTESELLSQIDSLNTFLLKQWSAYEEATTTLHSILRKYHCSETRGRHYQPAKHYPGIISDFITDNERLYDILTYSPKISYHEHQNEDLITISFDYLFGLQRAADKYNYTTASARTSEILNTFKEGYIAAEEFKERKPMTSQYGEVRNNIKYYMDQYRQGAKCIDLRLEIRSLILDKKMETNEQWMRWVQEQYTNGYLTAKPASEKYKNNNPNSKKFFTWLFGRRQLGTFVAVLYDGIVTATNSSRETGTVLKNEKALEAAMVALDAYRDSQSPGKPPPLNVLIRAYEPHLHPREKQYVISDLLRMGLNMAVPVRRTGRNNHKELVDVFERRIAGKPQTPKANQPTNVATLPVVRNGNEQLTAWRDDMVADLPRGKGVKLQRD